MTGGARLFDLHCHLDFLPDPAAAAAELDELGVSALSATVTPGGYLRARAALVGSGNVRVGLGLHPWWVADGSCGTDDLALFTRLAAGEPILAEVGLDYARGREASRTAQLAAFELALDACEAGGRLLSVHAVRSASDVLDALERHGTCRDNACVLHWFSGTSEELRRAVGLGCLFSVGPRMLATRRGREYARQLPAERLLLETDLPGSPAQGRTMGAADLARGLGDALATLRELHGTRIGETIANTGARLLGLG